jgi:hypothetical protein
MGTDRQDVISLEPHVDARGNVVWAERDSAGHPASAVDLRRDADGTLSRIDESGNAEHISVLPHVRMAADDPWADIIKTMGDNENATIRAPGGRDVVMAPGGQMRVTDGGGEGQPLSVLPKVRMAAFATNPGPDPTEVREIMLIDPQRVEGWQPVRTRVLNGWRFHLRPEPGAPEFQFLAFRSPADRNLFRVYVISPNADHLYGHQPHMIKVVVGYREVPVICGPRGEPARDLATARGHAGKWMLYTYQRVMRGRRPGFSE